MPHVDDGTLHALLDGALLAEDPERARAVERHLERCDDCRARMQAAAGLREQASAILAGTDVVPEPDFEDVLARARRGDPAAAPAGSTRPGGATADTGARAEGGGPDRRRGWLPSQRLAWAATVILALGTGYLMRDIIGPLPLGQEASFQKAPAQASPEGEDMETAPAAAPSAPARTGAQAARQAESREPEERVAGENSAAEEERSDVADLRVAPQAAAQPEAAMPRQARADAVDAAGAAGAADQATAETGFPAEVESASWAAVTVDRAREVLDGPLYVLPRAELSEVYLDAAGDQPRVMSVQTLSSGVPVRVVQERAGPAGAAADAASGELRVAPEPDTAIPPAAARPATPDDATGARRGRFGLPAAETVRVTRGPFLLQVSGSIPAELLTILAEGARPAP